MLTMKQFDFNILKFIITFINNYIVVLQFTDC